MNTNTTDICGKSLGVGWWCVKPDGHAPPCKDADERGIAVCDSCSGYKLPTEPTCRPDLVPRATIRFSPCEDCGKPPDEHFGMRVFDRRVVPTVEALEAEVMTMRAALSHRGKGPYGERAGEAIVRAELEALRAVEGAALAYVPYPAKTFDERHSPLREGLILALANVVKVRGDAAKGKVST